MSNVLITPVGLARSGQGSSEVLSARYDHATQLGTLDPRAAGRALRLRAAPLAMSSTVGTDGPPSPDSDIE